jgi:hypothetical protein
MINILERGLSVFELISTIPVFLGKTMHEYVGSIITEIT